MLSMSLAVLLHALLLPSLYQLTISQPDTTRQISSLLHEQALSHLAFHSDPLKLALARLFSPRTIAIVGVEWGSELVLFADNNFTVYAFEPATKYVHHLRSTIDRNPHWNVSLIPIAAGNKSEGTVELQYDNDHISEPVPVGRVDQYIREPLGVYSLDIQGDEWHVLQGSSGIFDGVHSPASLWIEAIACNPKVIHILEMLYHDYVLFDFVPWGKHIEDAPDSVPQSRQSFVFAPDRPSEFDAFLNWMCDVQNREFEWLQTDFLAVRRDLLGDTVKAALSLLSRRYCAHGTGVTCRLNFLLNEKVSDLEKDEL